ncbi:hypothetical protein MSG28_010045 [Choristoneura fumiferana]|uniref:Uncharacterized protein n=1 Tax=Choristoneura fumiferana TaxID=7141 RepID=A0ACC0KK77_CHOFU|nr:hypothetical protein MSG28_010045 [Choristoneura fumiferana]
MSKSNKIVVHVPDDYIARSCEIVNRWLDKNEKYLNSFPPEHDEITKIEDFRFSRRNRQWNRPVLSSYLPTSSVREYQDLRPQAMRVNRPPPQRSNPNKLQRNLHH